MGSALVVVVEPVWQGGGGRGGAVGDAVGPFAAHGLVEALDLAVGARRVGRVVQVAEPRAASSSRRRAVLGVAPGVVGHHPPRLMPSASNQARARSTNAVTVAAPRRGAARRRPAGVVVDDGVDVVVADGTVALQLPVCAAIAGDRGARAARNARSA